MRLTFTPHMDNKPINNCHRNLASYGAIDKGAILSINMKRSASPWIAWMAE